MIIYIRKTIFIKIFHIWYVIISNWTGRKLRVSALHPKLEAAGVVYGEVLGYERPLFFKPDGMEKSILKKVIVDF
jgi:hypothetical protein